MRRRYTADEYRRAVALIRENVPDVAITTDVIAGFPGETDEDFEATYELCRELRFAAMHCFPYSRRPQTGAAVMPGHLPAPVRRERLERLLEVARESALEYRRGYVGRTLDVLWEEEAGGVWQGLTGNYIRVYAASKSDLSNRLLPAHLSGIDGENMTATLSV